MRIQWAVKLKFQTEPVCSLHERRLVARRLLLISLLANIAPRQMIDSASGKDRLNAQINLKSFVRFRREIDFESDVHSNSGTCRIRSKSI